MLPSNPRTTPVRPAALQGGCIINETRNRLLLDKSRPVKSSSNSRIMSAASAGLHNSSKHQRTVREPDIGKLTGTLISQGKPITPPCVITLQIVALPLNVVVRRK